MTFYPASGLLPVFTAELVDLRSSALFITVFLDTVYLRSQYIELSALCIIDRYIVF